MNKSAEINELAKALTHAQSEIITVATDSKNPFFKSSYASLPGVLKSIREPLSKNGLSFVQTTSTSEQGVCIETVLMHTSGQWISGSYPVNPIKNDPQGLGSAITYARRYALTAMLGIHQEDDDGNNASKPQSNGQTNGKSSDPLEQVIKFGKFKDQTWKEAASDVDFLNYIEWCISQEKTKPDSNNYKQQNIELFSTVKEYAIGLHGPTEEMGEIPF